MCIDYCGHGKINEAIKRPDSENFSLNLDSDSRRKWVDLDLAGFGFEVPGFAIEFPDSYIPVVYVYVI